MTAAFKGPLRKQILAERRALPAAIRQAEAATLKTHVTTLAGLSDTVCAYVPVGSEPGSVELLDALVAMRLTVLLPVSHTDSDGTPEPLRWGVYRAGHLVAAGFGLREPAGDSLPPETVAQAGVILVPALAVDRRGARLGRGAGFYDRSLPLRDPAARLIAVVRDQELLDELPSESHDVRMTDALTPNQGVQPLGPAGMRPAE
ncbi:MAG: 5-formyltetrahydrofolate cyclo-ligase [Mycobacterium sp.]